MQRCSDTSQEHHFYGPEWTNPTWSHAVTIHPPFASSLLATLVSLGISGKFWPCRSKKHSRPGHVAWLGPSGVREGSLKPRSLLGGTPAKAEGGVLLGGEGSQTLQRERTTPWLVMVVGHKVSAAAWVWDSPGSIRGTPTHSGKERVYFGCPSKAGLGSGSPSSVGRKTSNALLIPCSSSAGVPNQLPLLLLQVTF